MSQWPGRRLGTIAKVMPSHFYVDIGCAVYGWVLVYKKHSRMRYGVGEEVFLGVAWDVAKRRLMGVNPVKKYLIDYFNASDVSSSAILESLHEDKTRHDDFHNEERREDNEARREDDEAGHEDDEARHEDAHNEARHEDNEARREDDEAGHEYDDDRLRQSMTDAVSAFLKDGTM